MEQLMFLVTLSSNNFHSWRNFPIISKSLRYKSLYSSWACQWVWSFPTTLRESRLVGRHPEDPVRQCVWFPDMHTATCK